MQINSWISKGQPKPWPLATTASSSRVRLVSSPLIAVNYATEFALRRPYEQFVTILCLLDVRQRGYRNSGNEITMYYESQVPPPNSSLSAETVLDSLAGVSKWARLPATLASRPTAAGPTVNIQHQTAVTQGAHTTKLRFFQDTTSRPPQHVAPQHHTQQGSVVVMSCTREAE